AARPRRLEIDALVAGGRLLDEQEPARRGDGGGVEARVRGQDDVDVAELRDQRPVLGAGLDVGAIGQPASDLVDHRQPAAAAEEDAHGPCYTSVMFDLNLSEEQLALADTAREFTKKEIIPVAGKLDEHGTFPKEILRKAWELGLMNCEVPEAYGGAALSCLEHCLILEEVAYGCLGVNTGIAGDHAGGEPPRLG